MKGRSALTNLLEALECWTRLMEEGSGLDAIYLDYKKVFDTVPHKKTDAEANLSCFFSSVMFIHKLDIITRHLVAHFFSCNITKYD